MEAAEKDLGMPVPWAAPRRKLSSGSLGGTAEVAHSHP